VKYPGYFFIPEVFLLIDCGCAKTKEPAPIRTIRKHSEDKNFFMIDLLSIINLNYS